VTSPRTVVRNLAVLPIRVYRIALSPIASADLSLLSELLEVRGGCRALSRYLARWVACGQAIAAMSSLVGDRCGSRTNSFSVIDGASRLSCRRPLSHRADRVPRGASVPLSDAA
jgi:hypothetical protein